MFAVVTGGSSRTGFEIVKHLLKKEYTVITNFYSNSSNLDKLKIEFPDTLQFKKFDLSKIDNVSTFANFVKSFSTNIDLIINTFGDYINKNLSSCNSNDLTYMLNTNLVYVEYLTKEFIHIFNKNGGSIINFGYSHGDKIVADTQTTFYHIAKMGLILLTKAYAKSLGDKNININIISPGVLENSIVVPDDIKNTIPMNRLGSFRDIITTIDYLIANRYTSGNNIIVSGGYNI